jgi:serine/threonine protein kinase
MNEGMIQIYTKMLGKGSFGEVYLGFNRSNGRLVAVKTENKSTGKDAKVLRHEKDMLKLLSTVACHAWEDPVKFYIAIPLLGPSLDALHEMCNNKFTALTCLRLGLQMIDAVSQVHAAGVLHRDIKPANFLVDYQLPHQRIHLVDFGLSKRYTEGTPYKTGVQRVGSLRYMSK